MVTEEIRSRYNASQETKILRMYLADPVANKTAFDEYNSFVEECRAAGVAVKAQSVELQAAIEAKEAIRAAEEVAIQSELISTGDQNDSTD